MGAAKKVVLALLILSSVCLMLPRPGAADSLARVDDAPKTILDHIRIQVEQLLSKPQPELYERHLRSVLALCEEDVLKLQFAGAHKDEQTKEIIGYLKIIESGLNEDRPETYLVEGRRALTLARLSRSDGTLQFYTVNLPPHWDPKKAYPLHLQLHGRGPDVPLAYVHYTFLAAQRDEVRQDEVIRLVPWLRGNGEWRDQNGSEPDIWEAIDDLQTYAKLDPDRWYISGHSWGGDDAWSIVQRTPDLWAAAGIMAGNPISAPLGLGLMPNAKFVPFYLWLGEQDKERKAAFDEFHAALDSVGNPPKLVVASGVGHMYRPEDAVALEDWLLQHVRHRPDHFSFVVDTPQHRGIWGISIPRKYPWAYPQAEPRVSFECWIESSTVRIKTTNTQSVDVNLGPLGLRMAGDVRLMVNGKQKFSGPVPEKTVSLTW